VAKLGGVTEPLAILFYEKLIPGSQLVNRLQDLGYRVQTITDAETLQPDAEGGKPLVVLADLYSRQNRIIPAIDRLRKQEATAHIPVIAFAGDNDSSLRAMALAAGATLVVTDAAISHHLPQLLEQALTQF
jgi:CheY-like chemotaxis protein